MKKLTAIILLLCMLTSLFACSKPKDTVDGDEPYTDGSENTSNPNVNREPTIVVPQYKDYGRGSVNFTDIVYSRPNIQAVIDAFKSATDTVYKNEKSIAEQILEIHALESYIENTETMYSIVEIYQSKDASSEFWKSEREYMSVNYPKLSQAVEDLLVACAKSEHKKAFEDDYFEYSLDEYVGGGIYTDAVVELMQTEAELEAKYSSLSTSTVEIEYKRIGTDKVFAGTVDEVKDMLREYFGADEKAYKNALTLVNELYYQKLTAISKPIYVELIKVRRLIADELGYSNYGELAYDNLGYEYSTSDMLALLKDVGEYVAPVAMTLEYDVFYDYFLSNVQTTVDRVKLINTLYRVYSSLGGEYSDAYSYMLQHGLYDVSGKQENRFDGAFSTYLEANSSPYLFMTTSGFITDYTTLAHEFGHFLDGYINYGADESLATMEVSSQALELLTLLKLNNHLNTQEYQYIEYYTVFTFLGSVLMTQSFYSAFEHMAYSLSYDEITEEKLEETVDAAFTMIFGDEAVSNASLSNVIITHTVLYPFYVESYVTSAFVSLDIFFAESNQATEGFKLYEALIKRDGENLGFIERIQNTGIDSPFKDGKVKETANNLYYYIKNEYFYKSDEDLSSAA